MNIDSIVYGYVVNEESFPDQAVVLKEGATGNWVYVVLEGQVKVKKEMGKTTVHLDTLKTGDVFGEMALFDKSVESRTATLIADGIVRLGVLDQDQLIRDYEKVSPQLKELIRALMHKLKDTTDKVAALALKSKGAA